MLATAFDRDQTPGLPIMYYGVMKIQVDCKGTSEPRAFHLGERRLHVMRVLERGNEDSERRFRVKVADGRIFVLRENLTTGQWTLARVN